MTRRCASSSSAEVSVESREVGTVIQIGDGIARVDGLRDAMAGELLEFVGQGGKTVYGLAQNLEEDEVGAVLLGDVTAIKENDQVRTTGRIVEVPSGKDMLGRVVNPLGMPIDGKGPIKAEGTRPVEFKAPGVIARQPVHEPMQTGILAIDSMVPDRPRPARAHHRRPPDRQDRHRGRRHHQPKGART